MVLAEVNTGALENTSAAANLDQAGYGKGVGHPSERPDSSRTEDRDVQQDHVVTIRHCC